VTGFGGEIGVSSVEGRGSTFRVTLPPGRAAAPLPMQAAAAPAPERRARILVVDDEELVGRVIRRALSPAHHVTVTTSASQALAAIEEAPFDLILCDVMLPEPSGVDLHAQLAERSADQARRMVFMSGGAFTARARKFLAEVPNPRLEKPFDPAL